MFLYCCWKGDYTNASIGTIIAVGSVLAILLQTVITHVTDRSSRLQTASE